MVSVDLKIWDEELKNDSEVEQERTECTLAEQQCIYSMG